VYEFDSATSAYIRTDTLSNGLGNHANFGNTISTSQTEIFVNDYVAPFFEKRPGIHIFDKTSKEEIQFIKNASGVIIRHLDNFLFSLAASNFQIFINDGNEWVLNLKIEGVPVPADGFYFVFYTDFALSENKLIIVASIEGPGVTVSNTRRAALLIYSLNNNIFTFDKMFQLNHYAKSIAVLGDYIALGDDRFDANIGMTDEVSGMSHGSVEVYKYSGSGLNFQYRLSPGTDGNAFGSVVKIIGDQLIIFELDKIHAFDFPVN